MTLKGESPESLHNTWAMIMSELIEPPNPKLLPFLCYRQIHHFTPVAEDVAYYERARYVGSPDQSFEWLWEASNRYLLMKGEDAM